MDRAIVIVGASLAGATAAFALRDAGYEGQILLIGDEGELPYERPPLSKKYLSGEQPFEKSLVRPAELYAKRDIDLALGVAVTRLDLPERAVELADGRRFVADKILLTTGGRNRRPPIPGLELDGVYDVRSKADADLIRSEASAGRRAVIVGMGFIGSEVAATLRASGVEVAAIEAFDVPLERVLGAEVGVAIADLHREHGVETLLGEWVARFEGAGRVERVTTASGKGVDCDFAVVGLGLQPNVELAIEAGLEVDNGIVVDELCRTSVDGIFAAGDVAAHFHPLFGERVRVEHWLNAIEQGTAAARSMLGQGEPYVELHWFWSDQFDLNLQYAGHHRDGAELVARGSIEARRFVGFYLEEGIPQAAIALNMGRDLRRSFPLLRARRPIDPDLLRDPEVDLRTLAPSADPA